MWTGHSLTLELRMQLVGWVGSFFVPSTGTYTYYCPNKTINYDDRLIITVTGWYGAGTYPLESQAIAWAR